MNSLLKLITVTSFLFSFSLLANDESSEKLTIKILTPSAIKSAIGEFPKVGSKEESLDFNELLDWQNKRSTEECDYAESQKSANLENLFVINNGPLTEKEAKRIKRLTFKKYAEAGLNIVIAKKQYNRPRPYNANPEIKPCIELESSSAFPSGHAAIAQFYAHILSEYYPNRRASFFKRSDEAALNRVIGGVHHPSDILAGKKLGNVIYELLSH
jgi:acid phosphatase (class A)